MHMYIWRNASSSQCTRVTAPGRIKGICYQLCERQNFEYINTKVRPHWVTQHAGDMSKVVVKDTVDWTRKRCVRASTLPEQRGQPTGRTTSIRTHCGGRCPGPRNPAGGPPGATCIGSYSTRRVGMTTSGCPGSSPRTPDVFRRETRKIKKNKCTCEDNGAVCI